MQTALSRANLSATVDTREVNRRFRSDLWPTLKSHGFTRRTERVAWRDVGDSVDLIEVNLIGTLADAVGCTSYSFGAFVASLPPIPQIRSR